MGIVVRCSQSAGFGHGGDPKRRSAFLHIARGDLNVFQLITFSRVAESLTGKTTLQHFNALIH